MSRDRIIGGRLPRNTGPGGWLCGDSFRIAIVVRIAVVVLVVLCG